MGTSVVQDGVVVVFRMALACAFLTGVAASPARAQVECLRAKADTFSTPIQLNEIVTIPGVIDTAATDLLILCNSAARALALPTIASVQVQTASGVTAADQVMLASIRIGKIEIRSVAAIVSSQSGPCRALVGLSLLRRLESVTLKGNTLTLVGKLPMGRPGGASRCGGIAILV
jgi:clan AA aspartic protease (TIGR02281 family)